MSRVFITAMAPVTPIGTGSTEFFSAMAQGTIGTGEITAFDAKHFPINLGAEAKHNGKVIEGRNNLDRKETFLRMAFEQLAETGRWSTYEPDDRMCMLGAGIDYLKLETYAESSDAKSHTWQPYSVTTKLMVDRLASNHKINGGNSVNVSACVASSQAMGTAFRILKAGQQQLIITGGVDSMLNPLHYIGFYKLGALSALVDDPMRSCRPYDLNRQGLVLGEGAVLYTFENETYAHPDTILAEICGYGSTMDAYMITDPLPQGEQLARAALQAINDAGITPDQIDCVHSHGTGTLKNDMMECRAMERIFGSRYQDVPVFSLKAQVGHMIAACGAAEFGAAIYSLQNQIVPATQNYSVPDPDIPLNVLREPKSRNIQYILKLNAAFGGQNIAFVLGKTT